MEEVNRSTVARLLFIANAVRHFRVNLNIFLEGCFWQQDDDQTHRVDSPVFISEVDGLVQWNRQMTMVERIFFLTILLHYRKIRAQWISDVDGRTQYFTRSPRERITEEGLWPYTGKGLWSIERWSTTGKAKHICPVFPRGTNLYDSRANGWTIYGKSPLCKKELFTSVFDDRGPLLVKFLELRTAMNGVMKERFRNWDVLLSQNALECYSTASSFCMIMPYHFCQLRKEYDSEILLGTASSPSLHPRCLPMRSPHFCRGQNIH